MLKDLLRRYGAGSLVLTGLAAIVIGCGGGGGGGGGTSATADAGGPGGSATTGTPTTAGGDPVGGSLPANKIFYAQDSVDSTTYDVNYVNPDGTSVTTFASAVPIDTPPTSPDPANAGKIIFAVKPTGSTQFGIYRNTTVSATGATTIVGPDYDEILSLQVSAGGDKVVFVAANGTADPKLYVVPADGSTAPVLIDTAFAASLSTSGDRVVYTKFPASGLLAVYVRKFTETVSTRVTDSTVIDAEDPQFNRAGNKVVFSEQLSSSHFRLAIVDLATLTKTTLDPIPTANQRAASFNSDGTRLSFVVTNAPTSTDDGLYTVDVAAGTDLQHIVTNSRLELGSYWTSANGRSGKIPFGLNLARKHR